MMTKKIYTIKRYNRGVSGSPLPGAIDGSKYCYMRLSDAKERCQELNQKHPDYYYAVKEFIVKE